MVVTHEPASTERRTTTRLPTRRTHGVECQALGEELMVMDAQANRVHVLNPTMLAVWELCDGTRSAEQIAAALAERFDCSDVDDPLGAAREALGTLAELDLLLATDGEE